MNEQCRSVALRSKAGPAPAPAATRAARDLPLVEELLPAPDPWPLVRRLAALPHLLFFDSAYRHPSLGRYSFITADPFTWIGSRGPATCISGAAPPEQPAEPFAVLAEQLGHFHQDRIPGFPPLQGGAAGVFGYEQCH